MSQLSSTLKRYVDSSRYAENTYSKMPSGYSSYTSYGSTYAYADRDKIGFKSSYLPSPRYHHSRLSPTSGYDSSRLPLYPDSSIRLSPAYIRTQPLGGGLSGGSCYSFTGTPGSPSGYVSTSTLLSRRRAISHSDLAQEFSGLHTSDSAYASSPSALYQAATHSDYVRNYLEKSSHCSLPSSPSSSQLCERDDGYGSTHGPDPMVCGTRWDGDTMMLVGCVVRVGFWGETAWDQCGAGMVPCRDAAGVSLSMSANPVGAHGNASLQCWLSRAAARTVAWHKAWQHSVTRGGTASRLVTGIWGSNRHCAIPRAMAQGMCSYRALSPALVCTAALVTFHLGPLPRSRWLCPCCLSLSVHTMVEVGPPPPAQGLTPSSILMLYTQQGG